MYACLYWHVYLPHNPFSLSKLIYYHAINSEKGEVRLVKEKVVRLMTQWAIKRFYLSYSWACCNQCFACLSTALLYSIWSNTKNKTKTTDGKIRPIVVTLPFKCKKPSWSKTGLSGCRILFNMLFVYPAQLPTKCHWTTKTKDIALVYKLFTTVSSFTVTSTND